MDLIRRLWHIGKYRDSKVLQRIHANWFHHWVDWKTARTMRDVDRQSEELLDLWAEDEDPSLDAYYFSEIYEDETPLGGEMRLRSPYKDLEDPSRDS